MGWNETIQKMFEDTKRKETMDKLNELLTQLRKLGFDMDCDGPDEEKEDFYIGSIGNLCVTVSLMKEDRES